jgi:transposase
MVNDDVFAGIDWGGSTHQLCLLDAGGVPLVKLRINHDVAGLAQLDAVLDRFPRLRVAIERAEGLLVEHLLDTGRQVYCVSPKISARARERYRLANTKSDDFDAFVLADTLRHEHDHWRALAAGSPLWHELRAVSRDRDRILRGQHTAESRLRATLETYHPGPLHLFSALDRDIALAFIADYPTPQAAARVGPARMAQFLTRHSYSGRTRPEVLVERLRPHLLAASPGTVTGRQFTAAALADQLSLLTAQLRGYDKHLQVLLDGHPDAPIMLSFTGIGTVIAAALIAEMGEDRDRFPTPGALLAEAGLAPVTRASGRTHQVRFRYAANHRMRHAIDWWMQVAIREDPWTATLYQSAREHGQGQYRALRGLGARWTRVLWRCWQDRTPYDATRHNARREGLLSAT